LTTKKAYKKLDKVIEYLQTQFYKENPQVKELPFYIWELFDIKEYYLSKKLRKEIKK
jgi:hypothetical protein